MLDLVSAIDDGWANTKYDTQKTRLVRQTTTANWTDSCIDMPRIAYLDY